MEINNIMVIGAGTMGNCIAHVFAQNGLSVTLVDVEDARIDSGLATIKSNRDRQVKKEVLTADERDATLGRIARATDLKSAAPNADLIIEVPLERVQAQVPDNQCVGKSPDAPVGATSVQLNAVACAAREQGMQIY